MDNLLNYWVLALKKCPKKVKIPWKDSQIYEISRQRKF